MKKLVAIALLLVFMTLAAAVPTAAKPKDPNMGCSGLEQAFQAVLDALVEGGCDSDADGVPDVVDDCPDDPAKTAPGACGCGVEEADTNDDGIPQCVESCWEDCRVEYASCWNSCQQVPAPAYFDCLLLCEKEDFLCHGACVGYGP